MFISSLLDQDSAEALVATPQADVHPEVSPDSAWIVYESFAKPEDVFTSVPSQLKRAPLSGGPSQLVLTAHGWLLHACARAPATICLVGERTEDHKQLVFTAFDPVKGRGREVARIATDPREEYWWSLSPDGSQIAMQFPNGQNRIRLLPLAGGAPHDLVAERWSGFWYSPRWSPDGRSFYVASSSPTGMMLLHMDRNGHASALWEQKGRFLTWGLPSPDGRRLAILASTVDSNVWMIENF